MEYVLVNLEGSNFKNFLARRPQPWWGLLRHYIDVKLSLSWPLHFLLLAAAPVKRKPYLVYIWFTFWVIRPAQSDLILILINVCNFLHK